MSEGKTVPELLRDGAAVYEERNAAYGNNYKEFGTIMCAMFPDGLPPMSEAEWNRFGVWMMILTKVHRYVASMRTGGHMDTANDIKVYGAMLEELTRNGEAK